MRQKLTLCKMDDKPNHWSIINNGPIVYLTCNKAMAKRVLNHLNQDLTHKHPDWTVAEYFKINQ